MERIQAERGPAAQETRARAPRRRKETGLGRSLSRAREESCENHPGHGTSMTGNLAFILAVIAWFAVDHAIEDFELVFWNSIAIAVAGILIYGFHRMVPLASCTCRAPYRGTANVTRHESSLNNPIPRIPPFQHWKTCGTRTCCVLAYLDWTRTSDRFSGAEHAFNSRKETQTFILSIATNSRGLNDSDWTEY